MSKKVENFFNEYEKLDNWRKESQCPEVECSLDLDYEMQYQSE